MDETQEEHQYPELRQFEDALPREIEKKRGIRPYKAPVCNKDGSLKDEEKDNGEYSTIGYKIKSPTARFSQSR